MNLESAFEELSRAAVEDAIQPWTQLEAKLAVNFTRVRDRKFCTLGYLRWD